MAPSATETVTTAVESISQANGVGKLSLNGKVDPADVCSHRLK